MRQLLHFGTMSPLTIGLVLAIAVVACHGYDYGEALTKSLLFYQAQRSGKLSGMNSLVSWRKDSALTDKGNNGEDLTGGYYDAGDFVKFGFPMAFTLTTLAWGIIDYEAGYTATNTLAEARNAIKWGTDYLLKAHISSNEFYGQVGHGQTDHNYWGRPEDMNLWRPAYKIDSSHPGSDLAAETAAAFAAASVVFRKVDSNYADKLVTHAKQLWNFADQHRGKYSDSIADAANYYGSYDYQDELVWGAIWVYRATNDAKYLNLAKQYYNDFGIQYRSGFGWDDKSLGATAMLLKMTKDNTYRSVLENYCNWVLYTAPKTPKGLVFLGEWGSLRNAAQASYICLQAADEGVNSANYRSFAKKQVDYMLGSAGRSYVVGYGNNPPTHEHHRAASCPDAPATCDWNTFNGGQANYHVLYGALVGGPDQNDNYSDVRNDATHNEVACDYNAAYQGLLAALKKLGY